jgi:hypothetical protein
VADDQQRAVELAQRLLQDLDGVEIEVVGRLVEEKLPRENVREANRRCRSGVAAAIWSSVRK